ncbi:twin-arginine translocation signal domain-containing protein [Bradyrhizobium sp. TZ2]
MQGRKLSRRDILQGTAKGSAALAMGHGFASPACGCS